MKKSKKYAAIMAAFLAASCTAWGSVQAADDGYMSNFVSTGTITSSKSNYDNVSVTTVDQDAVQAEGTAEGKIITVDSKNITLNVTSKETAAEDNNPINGVYASGALLDQAAKTGKVILGNDSTEKIDITVKAEGNYRPSGLFANLYGAEIDVTADELNVSIEGGKWGNAIRVKSNTQVNEPGDTRAKVVIGANTINLTTDSTEGSPICVFSNGLLDLTGDATIVNKQENGIAIDVRGHSTTNINTDGQHKTVMVGDIALETPNTTSNPQGSGNLIGAAVNVNFSGEGSSWTGRAYQQLGSDANPSVELKNESDYYGDATELKLAFSKGATWNMTGDSFVNVATVEDGASINVSENVSQFNAGEVTLNNGALNIENGIININTLNASNGSKINLNGSLFIGGGTATIAEFNTTGGESALLSTVSLDGEESNDSTSLPTLALSGDAKVTLESGEADLFSISTEGTSSLTVGSGAEITADTIDVGDGNNASTFNVESGAKVEADEITVDKSSTLGVDSGAKVKADAITANDSSTVKFASGSNVSADMYVGDSASVKALGNFSGTFYNTDTTPQKLDESTVQEILGVTEHTLDTQQLKNGSYIVNMNVGSDGKFSLSTNDTSGVSRGGSMTSHELGAWDKEGNYTAYGNYDANAHDISNVGTLSAANITLGEADLAETLEDLGDQVKTNAEEISDLKNMSNLTEEGKANVKKLATGAVEVTGGTGVTVSSETSDDGTKITYKVSMDANTIGSEIGTGEVAEDDNKLVTGATVYNAIQEELGEGVDGNYIDADATVNDNLSALDAAIGSDMDYYGDREELNNISTTTANPLARSNAETPTTLKENIGALDAAMGKVSKVGDANDGVMDKDGHLIGSADSGYGANLTDAVLAVDEKVGNLNPKNQFLDTEGKVIGTYNVLDGKESLANNLEFIDHAIGTTADGAYVSSGNSVGQNLNALDQGLSNLDRGLNDLGDRLNKVGAGAAALAALHPEGFDPDDKLSFAVGYGHYKNANASAIGAFYKPNRDTTFSIASTIGNGSTMLNAGVSFKIGKSSHVEKAMVAKADYDALQQKVASQDAEIEELKKQVALLVAKG